MKICRNLPMPAVGNVESSTAQSTLVVELLCFLVLALITIFRKKLSSNDGYRNEGKKNLEEIVPSNVASTHIRSIICNVGAENHCHYTQSKSPTASLDGTICLSSVLLDENILLNVVNYLADIDIGQLASSSRCLHRDCTADFIWEQLWMLTFGVMWCDNELAEIRRIRGISWNPMNQVACESDTAEIGSDTSVGRKKVNCLRPVQGWLRFYLEFEFCWMDWLMAGCCTPEYCLIGLYGSLYNITNFLPDHPVSYLTMKLFISPEEASTSMTSPLMLLFISSSSQASIKSLSKTCLHVTLFILNRVHRRVLQKHRGEMEQISSLTLDTPASQLA